EITAWSMAAQRPGTGSSSSSSSSARARAGFSGTTRPLGGLRTHLPSLLLCLACAALSAGLFLCLGARDRDRARAAFQAEATPIVSNLRSAFELPLEILE